MWLIFELIIWAFVVWIGFWIMKALWWLLFIISALVLLLWVIVMHYGGSLI